jgi:signal transduction histidine kinase
MKILLVEDDKIYIALFERMVRGLKGLSCFKSVERLSAAIEVLGDESFDLIFLDVNLPDSEGVNTVQKMNKYASNIPIIIISALAGEQTASDMVHEGAQDYLVKGAFGKKDLERSIRYSIDRKNAQKERDEMYKKVVLSSKLAEIGELSASIAHEINNPLSILTGNIYIINNFISELPDVTKKCFKAIENAAERIEKIAKGLTEYSRMETNEIEKVNLNSVVNGSLSFIGMVYKKNGINIETKLSEDLPTIDGNVGRLQQVMMNILANAKDSMIDKNSVSKVIIISTQHDSDKVTLRIQDTGTGIEKESLKKLFDSFFTTKPAGKGTGLGLAISKSMVEEMQGKIFVESEVNIGTTFILEFPIAT